MVVLHGAVHGEDTLGGFEQPLDVEILVQERLEGEDAIRESVDDAFGHIVTERCHCHHVVRHSNGHGLRLNRLGEFHHLLRVFVRAKSVTETYEGGDFETVDRWKDMLVHRKLGAVPQKKETGDEGTV